MEQVSKKWSVTSKGFFIAISIAETLAKFVSIIMLIRAFSAFQDAIDAAGHARPEEKDFTLANHALPSMQSAIEVLLVSIAILLVCGFLRHRLLKKVVK